MTRSKAMILINKIRERKSQINKIMRRMCEEALVGKHYKDVDYEKLSESISMVHPFILKLLKNYPTIEYKHSQSIGNDHINCQVFQEKDGVIRKIIVRNYHCEHMIYIVKTAIEEEE